MTPVQLPEVPAREVVAHHIHGTEAEVLAFRLDIRNLLPGDLIGQSVHVLTADQLRAYATEAVRLNAIPAVFIEQMEMLREDFQRFANGDPKVPFVVVRDALVQALNEWDEITQPEQNSER